MSHKIPNTFIVGAPKCGTTSLAAYLDEHPDVFISNPKEPFYWSHDYPGLQKRHGMDSLDKYLSLFDGAGEQCKVVGEGSTNYLRSSVAVAEIMKFNPDAKFIAMLRNPVEVVHAFHSEILFSYIETEPDFEKAWAMQADRLEGRNLPANCEAPNFLQYRQVASYAEQVRSLFNLVPPAQRKIIVFDDFKADCGSVFHDVVEFLELPRFEKSSFARVNAAHGHRYPWLSDLVLDPPAWLAPIMNGVRKTLRGQGGLVSKLKSSLRKPHQRDALRPEFKELLCREFAHDVAELSELLGRDLTHWTKTDSDKSSPAKFPTAETGVLNSAMQVTH